VLYIIDTAAILLGWIHLWKIEMTTNK